MGHAEHRIEAGVRIAERALERSVAVEELLEPGILEGVVHLAGMEVDFHLGVVEQVHFRLLVQDLVRRISRIVECLDDTPVRAFYPKVDVAAQTPLRLGVQAAQAGAFEDAAPQSHLLQNGFQLFNLLRVAPVDAGGQLRELLPLVHQLLRRTLIVRQPEDALVQDGEHRLLTSHRKQQTPDIRSRGLFERIGPPNRNEQEVAEWMHGESAVVGPAEGMGGEGQLRQGVIVALEPDWLGVADLTDYFDAGACLADAEALARKYLLVAECVKLGETLAEFELLTVDAEGPVGALFAFNGIGRQAVGVDAEEVAYAGLFQTQVARHAVETHHVYDIFLDGAEDPLQHVVEVHSYVGGDAAALVYVAFP